MKFLLLLLCLVFQANAYARRKAIFAPLPVNADTVALWNFDNDSGDSVVDGAPDPITATAYNTVYGPMPELDVAFGNSRFFAINSFVDLNQIIGSKLDFTGKNEVQIEAVIRLNSAANSNHMIVSIDNVRLMVINNHLAGFIRQGGGLLGVVGDTALQTNTNYSVGMSYVNQKLTIVLNGRSDGQVILTEPIATPSLNNARGFIGGDLLNKFFPGYIDNVRIQSKNSFDVTSPQVTLNQPTSFVLNEPFPQFNISFTEDLSGVDLSSVRIYLNGIQQNMTVTTSGITGVMNDSMKTGQVNEVKVVVSDLAGNQTIKIYNFSFTNILARTEYEDDANTLGLWHMNDFSSGTMMDSSSHGNHGIGDSRNIGVTDGVFGAGKLFLGSPSSLINTSTILIPGQEFTIEMWLRPNSGSVTEEVLFNNGQIKLARYSTGQIRLIFYTTRHGEVFETTLAHFPAGQLHHLAVTWNGNLETNNLNFYVDGALIQVFTAPTNCDFDPIPRTGAIGQYYSGMIDEVRFSSIVRTGFNIPSFDNQAINFLAPLTASSVSSAQPTIHVALNTVVNPNNIILKLNGVRELPSANLTFTSNSIDGVMATLTTLGLNVLDVSFTDGNNIQRKKSEYFFYVKDLGGSEYTSDAYTVGLWHLNDTVSFKLKDSSGNNNHLEMKNSILKTGIMSNGRGGAFGTNGNNLPFKSRAFTVEGFFRPSQIINDNASLWTLNGPEITQNVYVNPQTGTMRVIFNSPDQALDQTFANLYPTDGDFHHVAFVHDPSRGFAQSLLLIDGEVKQAFNYKVTCDCMDNLDLQFGHSILTADELRFSKIARYTYQIGDGVDTKPSITQNLPVENTTISASTTQVQYTLSDADGILASSAKLYVNGVLANNLSIDDNGTTATVTGTIALSGGSNLLEMHVKDISGNEQVKGSYIFSIIKGLAQNYTTDADTVVLYHMDEVSGNVLADSSGNGYHLSTAWNMTAPGVFGTSGATIYNHGNSLAIDGLTNLGTYTIEAWTKPINNANFYIAKLGNFFAFLNNGVLSFNAPSGHSFITPTQVVAQDGQFHHLAFIIDTSHPYHNLYLVVDGVVKFFAYVNPSFLRLTSDNAFKFAEIAWDNPFDEFRFSKVGRYTLNYSQNKKNINQKAKR